jgi:hypothetical protein
MAKKVLFTMSCKKMQKYSDAIKPRAIVLVCDATFYGKRKDKLGTLVFKDDITKEILLSKHIEIFLQEINIKSSRYLALQILSMVELFLH